jgi:hypothetical protein
MTAGFSKVAVVVSATLLVTGTIDRLKKLLIDMLRISTVWPTEGFVDVVLMMTRIQRRLTVLYTGFISPFSGTTRLLLDFQSYLEAFEQLTKCRFSLAYSDPELNHWSDSSGR